MATMGRHVVVGNRSITINDFKPAIPGEDGQVLSYEAATSSQSHLKWVDKYPPYGAKGMALLSDGKGGAEWGHDPYSVTLQDISAYANSTTNVPYGDPADVTLTTTENGFDLDLAFDFVIPFGPQGDQGIQGETATIEAGTATSVPYDQAPYVTNVGTPYEAVFDFKIPYGAPGDSAYDVWNKSPYGGPDSQANGGSGTQSEYFEFIKGEKGDAGQDSTVEVGSTISVPYGTPAEVVDQEAGDPYKLVLDFYIPYGGQGEKGDQGLTGPSAYEEWMIKQGYCWGTQPDDTIPYNDQLDKLDDSQPYCSFDHFLEDVGNGGLDDWNDAISQDPNNLLETGSDDLLLVDGTNIAKLYEENVFIEPNNFEQKLSVGPDETFSVEVKANPNPFSGLDKDNIDDFKLTPQGYDTLNLSWSHVSYSYDALALYKKDVDGSQDDEIVNVKYVKDATGDIDFDPYATIDYVDQRDIATLVDANAHSDANDAVTLDAANQHSDANDAVTLKAASDHSDANDAVTLDAANKHSDDNDKVTLDSSKAYTDGEVAKRVAKAGDTMTGKLTTPALTVDYGPDIASNRNTFLLYGNVPDGSGGIKHSFLLKDYRRQTPSSSADYIDYYGATAGGNSIMNRGYADGRYANKGDTQSQIDSLQDQISKLEGAVDRGNWEYIGLSGSVGPGEVSYQVLTSWADARSFKVSKTDMNDVAYDFHSVQTGSLVRIQTLDANLNPVGSAFYEITTFSNSANNYFTFEGNYVNHSGYGKPDIGDIQHLTLVPSGSIDDSGYAKLDRTNRFTSPQEIAVSSGIVLEVFKNGVSGVKHWSNGSIQQDSTLLNGRDGDLINRTNLNDELSGYGKLDLPNTWIAAQTVDRTGDELWIGKKGGAATLKVWADGSIDQLNTNPNTKDTNLVNRKNLDDAIAALPLDPDLSNYARTDRSNTFSVGQIFNRTSFQDAIVVQKSNANTLRISADGAVLQDADLANTNDKHLVTRRNLNEAIAASGVPKFKSNASGYKLTCLSNTSSHSHSMYFMPMTSTGNNSWVQYVNSTNAFAFYINQDWFDAEFTDGGTVVVRDGTNAIFTGAVHYTSYDRTLNGKKYAQVGVRLMNTTSGSWVADKAYDFYFSGTHWA